MPDQFNELVEAGDLNRLLREVDALCEHRRFENLLHLRQMCTQAVEQRGKQLWPIAEHIAYRVVLEGPPELGGPLLTAGSGRFAPGPLNEVAASVHSFEKIAPFLPSDQARSQVAAERVVRGENLSSHDRAGHSEHEMPMQLMDFEPAYRLARYLSNHVEVEEPQVPSRYAEKELAAGETVEDDELEMALLDLVRPWTEESGGRADVAVVEGGVLEAIGALGLTEAAIAPVDLEKALELMAWAASSSGVFGRRRGAAYGRFAAWWALAEICDLPWPIDPLESREDLQAPVWFAFEKPGRPSYGWHLGLACASQQDGWSCAILAEDLSQSEGGQH